MSVKKLDLKSYQNIKKSFDHVDTSEILKVYAPGRINLIGEHIDYNGGNVFPAAIDKHICIDFKKNNSQQINILSEGKFEEGYQLTLQDDFSKIGSWLDYLLGILSLLKSFLKEKNKKIDGFDCLIKSDLPIGAGISSSAALLCGFLKGMNWLYQLGLEDIQIIKFSQKAEQIFSGANVGVMDQFAVVKGKKNHFLFLDCETLEYKEVKVNLNQYCLLLFNSQVTHNLGDSAYNERRNQCENALAKIKKKYPAVKSLAKVTDEMIQDCKDILNEIEIKRANYVVAEQKRVIEMINCFEQNDLVAAGQILNSSHEGLKDLYEVSCKELDFLAEFAKNSSDILGGRMMGGGFGGCTINLVFKKNVDKIFQEVKKKYYDTFNIELTVIEVNIGDGVFKK